MEPRIHHGRNTVSIEAPGAMIPGRAPCKVNSGRNSNRKIESTREKTNPTMGTAHFGISGRLFVEQMDGLTRNKWTD